MKKLISGFCLMVCLTTGARADYMFFIPCEVFGSCNPDDFAVSVSLDLFGSPFELPALYQGSGASPCVHTFEIVGSLGQMGIILGYNICCQSSNYCTYIASITNPYWEASPDPLLGETLDFPAYMPPVDCCDIMVKATEIPISFELKGAFPNPFNPTTTIEFDLPITEMVNLNVYNLNGQLVRRLVDGTQDAGKHSVTFDATGLASGVYLYTIEAGAYTANSKMVLVK